MRGIRLELTLFCTLAIVATSAAVVAEPLQPGVAVEKIDETLWMHQSDKDWGDGKPITANGLFVIGQDSIAMVDTAWTDEQTGVLIDWAEATFKRPVRHVISTHWHWDRMGGMAEVNRRRINGYALDRSAKLGAEHGIEPPSITFHETLRIELGNESLEVHFAGPGHTVDNTVVWLERRKWLFGGCLIKAAAWSGLGYLEDADVPAWGRTLQELARRYRDATRVIPGHGVSGGLELVEHTAELVTAELRKRATED